METSIEKRTQDLIYKIISIYLAIDFVLWGFSNFTTDYDFDTRFGYPEWVYIPIGVAEILAGFGLLHARTNLASVIVLLIVMGGAVFSHVHANDGGYSTPLKYFIYFALMLYYKRGEIRDWF